MLLLLALVIVGKAQTVLLSEDFNQGFPSTWYNVDADGDGNIWGNFAMTGHSGAETDSCATSKSYDGATESALHPDNWLITPAVTIPAGSYSMLSFWVCAQDASWPSEHYGVYVTTSNDYLNTNNYTLLFEETLDANGGARAQGAWKQKTAVLNAYAGQTVHIAFRHFNCTDMFYINLDDVAVEVITEPTLFVSPESLQFTAGSIGSNFGRKSFSVNGVLLSNDVTISLPENSPFGISTDTNATYGNTVTLPQNNGTAAATVYVVFNPTTIGYYEKNISVVSNGASSHNIPVKGLALNCNEVPVSSGHIVGNSDHGVGQGQTAGSHTQRQEGIAVLRRLAEKRHRQQKEQTQSPYFSHTKYYFILTAKIRKNYHFHTLLYIRMKKNFIFRLLYQKNYYFCRL